MVRALSQVNIPPWLGKIFRFTLLRSLENAVVKLLLQPSHDLIISPPMQNKLPHKSFPQNFVPP